MKISTTARSLAAELVSIPSYVDESHDETRMVGFLEHFARNYLPEMTVERQFLPESSRCNLILKGSANPRLLVVGHIDTVHPVDGWLTDPLTPDFHDNKMYGLGASDMKSALAAFLCALVEVKSNIAIDQLMVLMYVDEEYDFSGMKRFVSDSAIESLRPDMILSLDGDLEVASGCRGLIEMNLLIKGASGHSSNPNRGTNAIVESVEALQDLVQELERFTDPDLGPTTMNLAYIQGGVRQEDADGGSRWLREGNSIPDCADLTVEVRPATPELNVDRFLKIADRYVKKRGLKLVEFTVRHDIAPWPVAYDTRPIDWLKSAYKDADVPFRTADRTFQGYIDAQMVAEMVSSPTFIIGTGGQNKHGANEFVPLENIDLAVRIYRSLLREVLSSDRTEQF